MTFFINSICIIIILLSMFYFYYKSNSAKKTPIGQQVLANTIQFTMSAFILGLGIILTELNAFGLSKNQFVDHLLLYGGFVCIVNSFSMWYFSRTIK